EPEVPGDAAAAGGLADRPHAERGERRALDPVAEGRVLVAVGLDGDAVRGGAAGPGGGAPLGGEPAEVLGGGPDARGHPPGGVGVGGAREQSRQVLAQGRGATGFDDDDGNLAPVRPAGGVEVQRGPSQGPAGRVEAPGGDVGPPGAVGGAASHAGVGAAEDAGGGAGGGGAAAPATVGRSPRVNESRKRTTSAEVGPGSRSRHTLPGTRASSARRSRAEANRGSVRLWETPPSLAAARPARVAMSALSGPA